MEQAVFEVTDYHSHKFKLIEGQSDWVKKLLPKATHQNVFIINDDTPFLLDFLFDANQVWHNNENAKLKSGLWTEVTDNGKELHLEAIAIKHQGNNLLLITNQSDEFSFRQKTLQTARELLLSNDKLIEQNEYLNNRIQSILKQPSEQSDILLALTKAIENASFGVLITNADFITLIENSSAEKVFNVQQTAKAVSAKPVDIITKLLINQLPEYDRIITTKSSWTGELCWMSPPSTLKWLKVALYPVKNELNELTNWIVFINDISDLKHLVQHNEQLALLDMLTELPNRISFWQALEQHIAQQDQFYLLYIDINDFRHHNEFYGHEAGDELLIEVSIRLKEQLTPADYLARVGGDEFAIILSQINCQKDCQLAVDNIINHIKKPFYTANNDLININVNVGAASYPNDAKNVEELMKFVDLSAYSAKKGKNSTLQFYDQSIKEASDKVLEIEHELKTAVTNNEFELYLQPIVDLEQRRIVKAEALIRWNHPQKGIVGPVQFIPIAEQSELIITIGKWVIESACKIAKYIEQHGYKIKISMNLSPTQVLDDNLFNFLYSKIKTYNVEPALLELEVTEGVLVDDYSVIDKLLSKVRAIGMSVSVDDFGTGYSSLAYLKKLPLDSIKIDKSFIQDIATDDNDKAIVRAVIAMAHNLNLGVIAEGVEDNEQLHFLSKNLCDSAQGYLFSRPIKVEEFLQLIKEYQ